MGGRWGGGGVLELGHCVDNGTGRPLILIIILAKMRIFDLMRVIQRRACTNKKLGNVKTSQMAFLVFNVTRMGISIVGGF
jgi:hypothetical protein